MRLQDHGWMDHLSSKRISKPSNLSRNRLDGFDTLYDGKWSIYGDGEDDVHRSDRKS